MVKTVRFPIIAPLHLHHRHFNEQQYQTIASKKPAQQFPQPTQHQSFQTKQY